MKNANHDHCVSLVPWQGKIEVLEQDTQAIANIEAWDNMDVGVRQRLTGEVVDLVIDRLLPHETTNMFKNANLLWTFISFDDMCPEEQQDCRRDYNEDGTMTDKQLSKYLDDNYLSSEVFEYYICHSNIVERDKAILFDCGHYIKSIKGFNVLHRTTTGGHMKIDYEWEKYAKTLYASGWRSAYGV